LLAERVTQRLVLLKARVCILAISAGHLLPLSSKLLELAVQLAKSKLLSLGLVLRISSLHVEHLAIVIELHVELLCLKSVDLTLLFF